MRSEERPVVLLIGSMYHPEGEQRLAERTRLLRLADTSPAAVQGAIPAAAAAFVRYPARLGAEEIAQAPALRVISTSGRGTDAVDLAAATDHGVAVVNHPGHGTTCVSEHTLGLMLALARGTLALDAGVRRGGGWERADRGAGIELAGRTLGIVGLGQIGSEVARKCRAAFGMRVLAYDPYVPRAHMVRVGAEPVGELPALLREAQVLSLHPELTDETRGMIGERELALLPPGALLINTARGAILQEAPLREALRSGRLAGAALDVFDPEPVTPERPLLALPNLIVTPHVAGLTVEARRALSLSAARQILQVLDGERPPHLLNPQVWRDTPPARAPLSRVATGGAA